MYDPLQDPSNNHWTRKSARPQVTKSTKKIDLCWRMTPCPTLGSIAGSDHIARLSARPSIRPYCPTLCTALFKITKHDPLQDHRTRPFARSSDTMAARKSIYAGAWWSCRASKKMISNDLYRRLSDTTPSTTLYTTLCPTLCTTIWHESG